MRFAIRSVGFAAAALLVCGAGVGSTAQARDHFSLSIGSYGPGGGFGFGYHDIGRRGRGHFHGAYNFNMFVPPVYYAPRPYYYPGAYYRPYDRPYYYEPAYYAPLDLELDLLPPRRAVRSSPRDATSGRGLASPRDAAVAREQDSYDSARDAALVAPIGADITWNTPDSSGTITTTRDGWAGERYCREYRQNVTVGGKTEEAFGTACKTRNGDWQMVANQ
jgi:hypothetical protein